MKPAEREDMKYSMGHKTAVAQEEKEMFNLLPKTGGKLLDIGCGEGSISVKLREAGFDVTGIDFSPVAIDMAKAKGLNAQVVDVDGGLPFADKEFAVAWFGDILEHVFDPILLMKEICRVLKDDGMALLTTPNEMWLPARVNALFGRSPQSSVYRKFGQCKHHTMMSLELLEYFIKTAGLKIVYFESICLIPKTKIEFMTHSKLAASLVGRVFIVKLVKA